MVRAHTVTAAAGDSCRVICDYCGSQHNYRGGEKAAKTVPFAGRDRRSPRSHEAFAVVSDRERSAEPVSYDDVGKSTGDLEMLLRRIIREESGVTPVTPADKWRGGELVLRPAREGLQEKSWPIETFFNKVVMLRNRLRTLEQQVNAADLPQEAKVKIQGYITACYGSLTSFNVLFADDDDRFRGSGGS